MKEAKKIVFLGTPEFAVESLDILVKNGYRVEAVITAPDQPAGRGQQLKSSPVKIYALEHGIKILQPLKLKDPTFIRELESLQADLFIVVAFRMLPEIVWKMPPLGSFNLHASLLPDYRGAAPINHAIINGETVTGVTTFFLRQEIDTGKIIFQEKIPIGHEETAGELHDKMKIAGAGLVLKTTVAIFSNQIITKDQVQLIDPNDPPKPAPKIFKEDCFIDWSKDTRSIYNKIRGLSPYPAAFTYFIPNVGDSVSVKIFRAGMSQKPGDLQPGRIISDGNMKLAVATCDGMIDIHELQQAGKKAMKTTDFLRGFRLKSDWRAGV